MKPLLLLALLWLPAAQAYINEPYIDPPNPDSRTDINILVDVGVCNGVYASPPSFHEIDGYNINLYVYFIDLTVSSTCVLPEGTYYYGLGAISPGSYTLNLIKKDKNNPMSPDELLYTIQFSVSRAPALPVPLLNGWGLVVLVLSLMLLAGWWYRRLQVRDEV